MLVRNFQIGDEAALHQVFISAIHGIAVKGYTLEQVEARVGQHERCTASVQSD